MILPLISGWPEPVWTSAFSLQNEKERINVREISRCPCFAIGVASSSGVFLHDLASPGLCSFPAFFRMTSVNSCPFLEAQSRHHHLSAAFFHTRLSPFQAHPFHWLDCECPAGRTGSPPPLCPHHKDSAGHTCYPLRQDAGWRDPTESHLPVTGSLC